MTHGLVPARLGFGGAAIGNLYRPVGDDAARATIDAAWDRGIRRFDTAPHYGFGLSERRLGDALADLDPGQVAFVSTKVGRVLRPVPACPRTGGRRPARSGTGVRDRWRGPQPRRASRHLSALPVRRMERS